MSDNERDRQQLVINLGEGARGKRIRDVLDQAATKADKPVSRWAREVLLAVAQGELEPPTVNDSSQIILRAQAFETLVQMARFRECRDCGLAATFNVSCGHNNSGYGQCDECKAKGPPWFFEVSKYNVVYTELPHADLVRRIRAIALPPLSEVDGSPSAP